MNIFSVFADAGRAVQLIECSSPNLESQVRDLAQLTVICEEGDVGLPPVFP